MIKRVTQTKFLGVTINENLKWTFHINNVCNMVSMSIGVIGKILLMLYNALILPIISYANIVWGFGQSYAIKNIHILQKRVIRIISNAGFREHTPPLFKLLDIMPIYNIHNMQLGIFMYRLVNNILPKTVNYPVLHKYEVHEYSTRSAFSYVGNAFPLAKQPLEKHILYTYHQRRPIF